MKIYRLKLKPESSQITPWHSDTIFGSICWALIQSYGEQELKNFLGEYEAGHFPLVISEGFEGDSLPKPMAGNLFPFREDISKKEMLAIAQKGKNAKKAESVSLDEFNTIINNGQVDIHRRVKRHVAAEVMHNQISRLTDTTGEGNLFEQSEVFWGDVNISLYLGIAPEWTGKILEMFRILETRGLGKRSSVGKGHFSIINFDEFRGFDIPSNANAFVTLSNYVPKHDDPIRGQYRTFVKYGKFGQDYAVSGYPFKKPILMIKPGAVFWANEPQTAYGRLVKDISSHFPMAVQCGCTLAIPAFINDYDDGNINC